MIPERRMTFAASDGVTLEASLALPSTAEVGGVACHPHPPYGGDMDNPVVVRVVETCAGLGLATLRFNFRGASGSTGTHDDGKGEQLAMTGHERLVPLATFTAPLTIVSGTADEHCPRALVERLRAELPAATLPTLEGANHFFFGKLFPLGAAIAAWARQLGARKTGGRPGAG